MPATTARSRSKLHALNWPAVSLKSEWQHLSQSLLFGNLSQEQEMTGHPPKTWAEVHAASAALASEQGRITSPGAPDAVTSPNEVREGASAPW